MHQWPAHRRYDAEEVEALWKAREVEREWVGVVGLLSPSFAKPTEGRPAQWLPGKTAEASSPLPSGRQEELCGVRLLVGMAVVGE